MHSQPIRPTPQPLTATHFSDPASTNPTHIARSRHHEKVRTAFRIFFFICSLIAIGGGAYAVHFSVNYRTYVIGWCAIWLGVLALGIILAQWALKGNKDRRERREMRNARMRMEGV